MFGLGHKKIWEAEELRMGTWSWNHGAYLLIWREKWYYVLCVCLDRIMWSMRAAVFVLSWETKGGSCQLHFLFLFLWIVLAFILLIISKIKLSFSIQWLVWTRKVRTFTKHFYSNHILDWSLFEIRGDYHLTNLEIFYGDYKLCCSKTWV